jgi:hypothetical protein
MHEQKHINQDKSNQPEDEKLPDGTGENMTREEFIQSIAEPMQEFALANSTLTHSEHCKAVVSGIFSRLIQIKNTIILHIIMMISPDEDESNKPFWHCSISILSSESRKPKTYGLWTNRERINIRQTLPLFLGDRGLIDTQGFMQTKTALHCHRDLTTGELQTIGWNNQEIESI